VIARASVRALSTSAFLLLMVGHVSSVQAAEPTKGELTAARALFAEGEADEDAGRWSAALSKIRRASSVKMTPGIRFHIALCEEKLGQLVPALDDYTAAQAAAQRENNREVLEQVTEPLAALRARVPTMTLNMPPNLVGAAGLEVIVDGAPFPSGLWGTPVPIEIGSHTVQARAPGRVPFAAPGAVPAVAPVIVAPPQSPGLSPAEDATPPHPPSRGPAIAATVSAAILVGAGVGAFTIAGSDQASAQATCLTKTSELQCGGRSAVQTWDAVALTAWIVAGAAGTAAIVLWTHPGIFGSAGGHAELGFGPGSLSLRGTF
jgi:hypothetical protein